MDYEKREMDVYRQGKEITDQFYIDDDYNVPDAKNDVRTVILAEGTLSVEDMKVVENYIRVSGKMNFRVLYATDSEEPQLASLEGRLPFEEMIYTEDGQEGNLFIKSAQADLTASLIHSRKLNIKALAEITICSEKKETIAVTTDISSEVPLYKKYKNQQLLSLYTMRKDTFRIKEEVAVGGTKESIGNLLWTEALSRKLDTRLAENELIITGELLLFCFYESLEGKTDWVEQTIPYEGRMECYGAGDHMYHQIYPSLTDVNIEARMDEDGEMRMLGVEATLEIHLLVFEEQNTEILEDIYSLSQECVSQFADLASEQLLMQNHSKCKIAERLSLPELQDDILQICHSSARIQVEHMEPEAGGVLIEGVLHIYFLYVKSDDQVPFDVWQGMVPFSYLMESNQVTKDMCCDIASAVEQLSIGLLGNDEIEIKAVLAFNSFLRNPVTIRNIDSAECRPIDMEEMEKRPGIVGYTVKEGDDLWTLAKNYSTTKEGIMEVNKMDSETINPGDKLLIFKENMSIL